MKLKSIFLCARNQNIFATKILSILLLLSLLLSGQSAAPVDAAGTIRHVKPTGSNSGGCTTWGTACSLQHAIKIAVSGNQIWVKQGTYKPGTARTSTFKLKNGVKIFGGFAGGETVLTQRKPAKQVTILSGAIGGATTNDNSYHVVTGGVGTTSSAVLDGFTVTGGNANNHGSLYGDGMEGGGMYNYSSSPTVRNVTFIANSATYGGAIYNDASSKPIFVNVTFTGNSAVDPGYGGAMANAFSSPILTNVTFNGNTSFSGGGGMYNSSSTPKLTNVTFSTNRAMYDGGAMYDTLSNVVIYDSIFWHDIDGYGHEFYDNSVHKKLTVKDSIISGGCPSFATCTHVIHSDPKLGLLQNNGGFTKTMALGVGSSAIDTGNNSTCASTDQRNVKRPQGPRCDMGAYERVK